MSKRVAIGVKNLHFAILENDTAEYLNYSTIYKVPGLIRVDISLGQNIDNLYADDKPLISSEGLGSVEVTVEKDYLSDELLKIILGYPENGSTKFKNNKPPFVAVLFQKTYSDGSSVFYKLFKGKFTEPDRTYETKGDTVNFQPEEITGRFIHTNYFKEKNNRKQHFLMVTADENSSTYNNEGDTWFDIESLPSILHGGLFTEEPFGTISGGIFLEELENILHGGEF